MVEQPPRGEYRTDVAHRVVYSRAACIYKRVPEGVLFPKCDEDLHWAMRRAREKNLPLTMRAGGSGLAGQTVGGGVVADVSRFYDKIVKVDEAAREAVVQPGLVLSALNRALAPSGLNFSPDPSSQDFCCIGGMVANNSKGARSVKYGATLAHVKWLRMVLADGSEVKLAKGFRSPDGYAHPALRQVASRILAKGDEVLSHWPRSRANASGYNLKECLGEGGVDLLPLFVGSEGTLAVFLEAGLNLTPLPSHRALAMVEFAELQAAGQAVQRLLPLGPSACELMGETFLNIIRRGEGKFPFELGPAARAILLLEADGESREEAESGLDALLAAAGEAGPLAIRRAADPLERAAIWSFRKAASPLLNRGRGRLKSVRFIEDGAVPTEHIPAYMEGVHRILAARGIEGVIFGHAGDGNFHVNPFMDLSDPTHAAEMPRIAQEVAELLASLQGTLSGEHGDGRLRTPFLPRIYGPLAPLFREIKLLLDPQEILNPGIIAPADVEPMDSGLRVTPTRKRVALPGRLGHESWVVEAERCHGCGTCRDFCPTAKATAHDLMSSRGRGHLLQALLDGDLPQREARRPEVKELFLSCLGCSLCEIHCPTKVDIAPLAAAFRSAYASPLEKARDRFFGGLPSLGYSVGPTAGRWLASLGRTLPAHALNRAALGMRSGVKAPAMAEAFAFDPAKLQRLPGTGVGKVAYFYGCYGNTYNPSGEALAAVSILRALGCEVVIPPQACCGVSKLSRGLVEGVVEDARFTWENFLPFVEEGYAVVVSSPSCLLALQREQPRHFPCADSERFARAVAPLFTWIRGHWKAYGTPELKAVPKRVVYQTPCHGAVLATQADEVAVLKQIPGLVVCDVTTECCGMAGSYGIQVRNASLSDAVASPLYARIGASQPQAIVTPCGSCKMQSEAKMGLPVLHPLSLLAEALGG